MAIAQDTHQRVEKLTNLTQAYATTGQGLESDYDRTRTELSLRTNEIQRADEQIRVVGARLAERLRLDPLMRLEPQETMIVPIELVSTEVTIQDLVAQGLGGRPEICESRSLVAEVVERLKREQYAPLIPSVLLGVSYGGFGGGLGGNISKFGDRLDGDVVANWELRNFGAGDRAARGEANSRLEQARLKEVMALDRVAREVVEAHAQVESRRQQMATAEDGIKSAISSYDHNLERIQNAQGLPIELSFNQYRHSPPPAASICERSSTIMSPSLLCTDQLAGRERNRRCRLDLRLLARSVEHVRELPPPLRLSQESRAKTTQCESTYADTVVFVAHRSSHVGG